MGAAMKDKAFLFCTVALAFLAAPPEAKAQVRSPVTQAGSLPPLPPESMDDYTRRLVQNSPGQAQLRAPLPPQPAPRPEKKIEPLPPTRTTQQLESISD